jgi:hypothetical protein
VPPIAVHGGNKLEDFDWEWGWHRLESGGGFGAGGRGASVGCGHGWGPTRRRQRTGSNRPRRMGWVQPPHKIHPGVEYPRRVCVLVLFTHHPLARSKLLTPVTITWYI